MDGNSALCGGVWGNEGVYVVIGWVIGLARKDGGRDLANSALYGAVWGDEGVYVVIG